MDDSTETIACQLLEVAPAIQRTIRAEMRHGSVELTVPLFRTLMFLDRNPGVSLLDLAGHLGLTSPTAFKIVDGLVSRKLVERADSLDDRRRITLTLTRAGKEVLKDARHLAQAKLAKLLGTLSAAELEQVSKALTVLQPLFIYPSKHHMHGHGDGKR